MEWLRDGGHKRMTADERLQTEALLSSLNDYWLEIKSTYGGPGVPNKLVIAMADIDDQPEEYNRTAEGRAAKELTIEHHKTAKENIADRISATQTKAQYSYDRQRDRALGKHYPEIDKRLANGETFRKIAKDIAKRDPALKYETLRKQIAARQIK